MQLVRALPADGRWRIIFFAGDIRDRSAAKKLEESEHYLDLDDGAINRYTPPQDDIDSVIEVLVILAGEHVKIEQEQIPDVFWPRKFWEV